MLWKVAWTLVLWWAILAVGTVMSLLGPSLQELATQLGVTIAGTSSLFAARGAGYMVGALWCGNLVTKFHNTAFVLLAPLAAIIIGAWWMPVITSYPMAVATFAVQGACLGIQDSGGNVMMLHLWRGSPYLNGFEHAFHFFFGIGAMGSPVLVRHLLVGGQRAVAAWGYTVLVLAVAAVGYIILGLFGPPTELAEMRHEGVIKKGAADKKAVWLTGAFFFVYVGIEVSYGGYIDIFSTRWLGESDVQGATLTFVYWCWLCVGRAVASVVTPFVHHARYLAAHIVLAILSISALWVTASHPGLGDDADRGLLMAMVPTAAFGFALAPLFPGAMLLIEEILSRPLSAQEASFMVGCAAAGETIMPLGVGFLFSLAPMSFCWSQLGFCLGAAILFLANGRSLLWSGAGASATGAGAAKY